MFCGCRVGWGEEQREPGDGCGQRGPEVVGVSGGGGLWHVDVGVGELSCAASAVTDDCGWIALVESAGRALERVV